MDNNRQGPRRFAAKPGAKPTRGGPAPFVKPLPRAVGPLDGGARLVALDTLLDVHMQDAYASLALGERLRRDTRMGERDRRLVTELVYGVLERQIRLDYEIDNHLQRKDMETLVRDILRLGAYQILFLDRIPANAAVDESVKLTRLKQRESYTGLVNAVLRNILRAKEKGETRLPDEAKDPAAFLSVAYSMPSWLTERLLGAYGFETTKGLLSYRAKQQGVTVRPNLEQIGAADFESLLRQKKLAFVPGRLPGSYCLQRLGDVTRLPEFQRGFFSIQGESAMLAAQVMDVQPGSAVLDACAAPGGKTALMAEAMHGSGRVYAWDIHPHRVELIRATARRLRLENVRTIERDATVPKEDLWETMDGVLLDAPCSGTGVMWEKPDVRYRQSPEKIEALCHVQQSLLSACCRYVKRGGALVYATCSLLPEENSRQIEIFLQAHPEFSKADLSGLVPDFLRPSIEADMLQILPHRDGMEGFFLCRMVRSRG